MSKKIYIWRRIERATDNYHREGGVVIVAESLEKALELSKSVNSLKIASHETPDMEMELLGDPPDSVVVFPDKGCC